MKCYVKTGANNPKWKGGKLKSRGYVYVYSPDHPFKTKMGYVREHRLVMEKILGRFLEPHEVVHHINGNIQDNSPENLVVCASPGRHAYDEHVVGHDERGRFLYAKKPI